MKLEAPPGFEPGVEVLQAMRDERAASQDGWARSGNEGRISIALPFHWAGHLGSTYSSILNYGCTSDLERLPEDQPREHPHQGVPGNRVERDDLV